MVIRSHSHTIEALTQGLCRNNVDAISKPLGCKWIFKKKMEIDGTIDKFNSQLVIQGFRQKTDIDYFDTNASVAWISTIRLLDVKILFERRG